MKKNKMTVTKDVFELAKALDLTPADVVEMKVRSEINDKIIDIVKKHSLTHSQVAKLAETSLTRVTAILNRNTQEVSTDLMLRILARLGYRATISFSRAA